MARSLSRTLIRTAKAAAAAPDSSVVLSRSHYYSIYSHSHSPSPLPDAEALAVRKIEDAIHRIIVKRSAPEWLPFVPGASYWVPPKRRNYGIARLVNRLANSLSDDQVMSLTTSRGWPSNAFCIQPPPSPPDASSDRREVVETSTRASFSEDEEG